MILAEVFSVASCVLGLLGILLAVIFYLQRRRTKRLAFAVRTFGLLSNVTTSLPKFRATFHGTELERLTAVRILLWNTGNDIVHASDIAPADPLGFRFPSDCHIVSAEEPKSSSPAHNVKCHIDSDRKNLLHLTFDYLAPREACLISLLHNSNENVPVDAVGTLMGKGPPKSIQQYRPDRSARDSLLDLAASQSSAVYPS